MKQDFNFKIQIKIIVYEIRVILKHFIGHQFSEKRQLYRKYVIRTLNQT